MDSTIDQESNVAETETDNLNRVFHPKRVVHQHQLIEKTETVEGKEGRNGFRGGTLVRLLLDLEVGENVTKRSIL